MAAFRASENQKHAPNALPPHLCYLVKSKGYSFINIAGLTIGMAISILIGLWIVDEFSFDKYAPNHDRIAKAMFRFTTKDQTVKQRCHRYVRPGQAFSA